MDDDVDIFFIIFYNIQFFILFYNRSIKSIFELISTAVVLGHILFIGFMDYKYVVFNTCFKI